jgi:hypothetical protein
MLRAGGFFIKKFTFCVEFDTVIAPVNRNRRGARAGN